MDREFATRIFNQAHYCGPIAFVRKASCKLAVHLVLHLYHYCACSFNHPQPKLVSNDARWPLVEVREARFHSQCVRRLTIMNVLGRG